MLPNMVCHKSASAFSLLVHATASHFDSPLQHMPRRIELEAMGALEPYRTSWDALADLPERLNDKELEMTGKWADLLPTIPEGQNYLWHTDRGGGEPLFGWRRRYWSFLLKLSKRLPAWTIQAQPGPATGPFHWCNRKLSAVELCRLQTFPDGIVFQTRHADIQKLVGNAVPSALAALGARDRTTITWETRRSQAPKAPAAYTRSRPCARANSTLTAKIPRLRRQSRKASGDWERTKGS